MPLRALITLTIVLCVTPCFAQSEETSEGSSGDGSPGLVAGFHISEAAQIRIPRVDGVPNTFSNVLGAGGVIRLNRIEISPQISLIYSLTRASVRTNTEEFSTEATGLGWDLGARLAFGWFGVRKGGFYFSFYPAYSHWNLEGVFRDGSTFSATVDEFATEIGFGYKIAPQKRWQFDFGFSVLHLGFRPSEDEIVSITSYPAFIIRAERF